MDALAPPAKAGQHDTLTVLAIALLAFIAAALGHEGLGHGLVAWFGQARTIVLAYTYLSTDIQSSGISVAGPLFNASAGLIAWMLLSRVRLNPRPAFFTYLFMAFNLLDAAAYLVYSGILNSGDLAVVIAPLPHTAIVRVAMVVAGLVLYVAITAFIGGTLGRFSEPRASLAVPAYIAPIALQAVAAMFNPLGLKYLLVSALPSTAGANAGLLLAPRIAARLPSQQGSPLFIERSAAWIAIAAVVTIAFVLTLGHGIVLRSL